MSTTLARAAFRTTARPRIAEGAFWLAAVACWFLFPDDYALLSEIAITGLFALSLDLALGFGGIISLGHAAFFGTGAYIAGIVTKYGVTDPLLGLAIAAAAATLLGLATSFLVLRGSDLTRIMVTISASLVLYEVANRLPALTGGADGLTGMQVGKVLGVFEFDLFGSVAYAYSLAVAFILFVIARRFINSPFGWSIRAVRSNQLRAASLGIPVNLRLVAIYTMAACYAGIAGALLAQTTQSVSLSYLSFERSADLLLMLIIGGVGYLYGGFIGAAIFKLLQDTLADLTPEYWEFFIGALLVAFVMVGRDRITAIPRLLLARVRGRVRA